MNPDQYDPFFLIPSTTESLPVTESKILLSSAISKTTVNSITNILNNDDVSEPLATTLKFPYTTALTLTIAIGCSLLVLNFLVFAAFYYHRDSPSDQPMYSSRQSMDSMDTSQSVGQTPQLQVTNVYKPSSPSHCGTMKSSGTYRTSLGASCDETCNNDEEEVEWPPEYTICCQNSIHLQKPIHPNISIMQHSSSSQQIPSPRTSAAPASQMEVEPLLVPEPFNNPQISISHSHSHPQHCPEANL